MATGGSALIYYWADKSSTSTTWAVGPGSTVRDISVGAGSGRITAAIADLRARFAGRPNQTTPDCCPA